MRDAEADDGDIYWFVADGVGPLLDPDAMDVVMTSRRSAQRRCAPRWPTQPSLGRHHRRSDRLRAARARLRPDLRRLHRAAALPRRPRRQRDRADAGAPVRLRPTTTGATCRWCGARCTGRTRPATTPPASWPTSSPRPTSTGIEVWLDVVFNHTGEADADAADAVASWSRRRQRLPAPRRRHVHRRQRMRQRLEPWRTPTSSTWCSTRSTASPISGSTAFASTSPRC